MRTSIDPAALAATTVAAALTVLYTPGVFGLWDFAIGVTLTLLLFSYNTGRHRRRWQSAAFAAVAAFTLTIIAGCVLQWLKLNPEWWWLPLAWAIAFVVVYVLDRLRTEPDEKDDYMLPLHVRQAAPPRRPDPVRPRPLPIRRPAQPPRRRPPPANADPVCPLLWCCDF